MRTYTTNDAVSSRTENSELEKTRSGEQYTYRYWFGSAYIGFGVPALVTAPHRHQDSLRAPIAGVGFVGRLQWRCGTIGAGRLDRCRFDISITHSSFWVQIWSLPFEHMTEEAGKDIGCKLGKVIEVDKRALQADQAKFLRVRVDLPIENPLRRGGYISNIDGERVWVSFKYKRLPTFCFTCGKLGHDDKHCIMVSEGQPLDR
ncbi:hypothetical protein SO802_023853 [Lithocarpus litseifolius]|uniref:CCHC-type domain-containing protein n=1 Tax=Lithocarpus litseifolius TaxID=425828 RepID=A0AAW2CAV6_9ROSI